ncbi:CCA tRNA nucleotidyltransferase [Falsihalocynthiibacter sp. BN13B15]|uniref:CCA tRNA nucleotidyltransferase n=1 Tax=Falsihalocynthiibacter sp. BN13B15 TaxID=3240871 RepID=UPI00350FD853
MRIEGSWLDNPKTQAIFTMLKSGGHQAYFVGGCVRNALLGVATNDIDIATDAEPTRVLALAQENGIRAVETGIEHGTVTLVQGKTPYEVTTFRRDVETDGRRAVVAFSTNIKDDARRRDFTMNALYADSAGTVVDPLNGLPDLLARRVRFIENAEDRIREDYLRILRFFRFYAWYGDPNTGIDAEGLAACSANLAGIETLANERIGAEMLKLLAAADPAPAVAAMAQSGVLSALVVGMDAKTLPILIHFETQNDVKPKSIRRLATLGGQEIEQSLRLSKRDAKQYNTLRNEIGSTSGAAALGYRLGAGSALDVLLLRSAVFETPPHPDAKSEVARGAAQVFNVSAADLMPNLSGAALGNALRKLEQEWINSDFVLSRHALIERVKDF